MKEAHLTLRLPVDLARALEREAAARRVPKSLLVREAVSSYLIGPAPRVETVPVTARDVARLWDPVPPATAQGDRALVSDVADNIADVVTRSRESPPQPNDPWA